MTVMRLVDRKKEETAVRRPNRKAGQRLPKQGNRTSEGPWREMHDRYGLLLRAFFRRFFKPIRLSTWQENRLKELNETGHVIYVMERASLLYYLFLNYTLLRLQLPLVSRVVAVRLDRRTLRGLLREGRASQALQCHVDGLGQQRVRPRRATERRRCALADRLGLV